MTTQPLAPQPFDLSPADYSLDVVGYDIVIDAWGDGYPWPVSDILNFLEGVFSDLRNWINDWIIRPIQNLWNEIGRPIVDGISGTISNMWSGLSTTIQYYTGLAHDAANTAAWWAQAAYNYVANNLGSIATAVSGIPGTLWGYITSLWSWIGSGLTSVADQVWSWIQQLWSSISSAIGDLAGQVWGWIQPISSWISSAVGNLANQVWGWIQQLWSWISAQGTALWTNTQGIVNSLWNNIQSQVTTLWNNIQHNLIDPLGDWLSRLYDQLVSWFVWWNQMLSSFWQQLPLKLSANWNPSLIQGLLAAPGSILGWVFNVIQSAAGLVWNAVGSRVPTGPDAAPSAIASIIGVTTTVASGLAAAKIIGQGVLPWITGLDRAITVAVKDVSDYTEINHRWIRPLFDAYVGLPTYYYFHQLFKPRLPSPSELAGLVGEGQISPDAFKTSIGYHGIHSDWADRLIELSYRPVPLFRLADMSTYAFAQPGWLRDELRKASYRPPTQQVLGQYIDQLAMSAGTDRGISALLSLYRDGFINDDQLRTRLRGIGYSDTAIVGFLISAAWMREADLHGQVVTEWTSAYAKDLISESTLRSSLAQLGWASDRIDSYISIQNLKKQPTPKRKAPTPPLPLYQQPAGQVDVRRLTMSYENGLIDRGTFTSSLRGLEMPDELVRATVDLSDARKQVAALRGAKPPTPMYDTEAGRLNVRTLLILFSIDEISEDDLRAGLAALEMESDLIDATVANAKAEATKRARANESTYPVFETGSPQSILFADSRAAYRRREISDEQFGQVLITLGYNPDDARAIIEAESLVRQQAPVPKPTFTPPYAANSPQALLYSNALTAYRQGTIDDSALHDILKRLGYDENQATQIISAEKLVRRVPEPPAPPVVPPWPARSPESILFANSRTAYRQLRIDDSEYRSILVYLGYTPQQADQIIAADQLVRKATSPTA